MNSSLQLFKVDNAIFLAAGFGSRFVPITYELPKGLIPVKGVPLIERQIQQLNEKGINDIVIVIGYLKEKFDYLIDKYGVKLIINPEYAVKNNLSSLYYARNHLKNTYILSADNWMEENIFNPTEEKSWYSCVYNPGPTSEWCVTAESSGRISSVAVGGFDSYVMYGPVFLSKPFSDIFKVKIEEYYKKPGKENYMWENVYIDEINQFDLYINEQSSGNVFEFETMEELRQFDPEYSSRTPNVLIETIKSVFKTEENKIVNIKNLKAGMTNRSFSFSFNEKSYIFRLSGEGSDKLINRKQESQVYAAIKDLNISDEVIYFDDITGNKISIFYENARNTNPRFIDDLVISMAAMRKIHQSGVCVNHHFNIENEIQRYLILCNERNAIRYTDNEETNIKMKRLIDYVKKIDTPAVLCHIDSNPDNIISCADGQIKIIDWEYAGMCDPVMDIAMYSIYSYYSKSEMDELFKIYLQREPSAEEEIRLYIYAALGGYLWAIWTDYKQSYGVEFGEYGMKMYRYAKDYYKHLQEEYKLK